MSLVCTAGAGRPLRVLFLSVPPGPENRPPPVLLGEATPLSPSSSLPIVSLSLKLTLRNLDFAPVRPYLLSRNFITRIMSPSFKPRVRSTAGVMSDNTPSSIESRLKLKAYLSH